MSDRKDSSSEDPAVAGETGLEDFRDYKVN